MKKQNVPRFLYPIESMKDGEKLYFDRSEFAFIKKGELPETTILVYINKQAGGSIYEDASLFYVEKLGENQFTVEFPKNMEFAFNRKNTLKKQEDWYFIEELRNFRFANEEDSDDEFDANFLPDYIKKIEDYIDGPEFYINKKIVDQKLQLLPDFLMEYLENFQEQENMKDFLKEKKYDKTLKTEEMVDGERKDYKMKLYDLIIQVIEREIEGIEKEKEEDKKIIQESNDEMLLCLNLSELDEELQRAILSENFERASKIRDLIFQKSQIENDRTGWLYHPVFLLTFVCKYL